LADAIQALYPDHPWDPSKFSDGKVPRNFWKDKDNQMKALDRVEKTLGITQVKGFLFSLFVLVFSFGLKLNIDKRQRIGIQSLWQI